MVYRNITTLLFLLSWTIVWCQDLPLQTVIQKGHPSSISAVAISPDGKLLATGSDDKTIKLWSIESGREIRSYSDHKSDVLDVTFSSDGKLIASAGRDLTFKIWDTATGELLQSYRDNDRGISSVDFSPDDKYLIIFTADRKAKLWDLDEERVIRNYRTNVARQQGMAIFSSNGMYLALGQDNGVVQIINVSSGDTVHHVRELKSSSCGGCFTETDISRDGKYFLSAADKGPLIVWNMESGEKVIQLIEELDDYQAAIFSPDGSSVVSASEDDITIWDTRSVKIQAKMKGHTKTINDVAWTPDGKHLISCGNDNTAIMWNPKNGNIVRRFEGILTHPPDNGMDLDPDSYWESLPYQFLQLRKQFVMMPDGEHIIIPDNRTGLIMWNWKTGKKTGYFEAHQKPVVCYDLSNDGNYMLTGGADNLIILWDVKTQDTIRTYKGHSSFIYDLKFSHEEDRIASAGYDGYAKVWDLKSGKVLQSIYLSKDQTKIDSPFSIEFSPNDLYIITGSLGQIMTMWEIDSGEEYQTFVGHTRTVSDLLCHPSDQYLISSSWDETIKFWDYSSGYLEKRYSGHTGPVNDLYISEDRKQLLSGSTDRTAILWDLEENNLRQKFSGHDAPITAVALTPDNEYVITCSIDGVFKFWDAESGNEIMTQVFSSVNDWIVTSSDGYFYGTDNARKNIHFVQGTEAYELDQFFDDFFQPDLLNFIFSQDDRQRQGINLIDKLKESPPPNVEITFPEQGDRFDKGKIDMLIKVTNSGGGIEDVKIMHNGKRLDENTIGLNKAQKKGKSVYQTYTVNLIPGYNTLSASAYSRGRIESLVDESTVMLNAKENPANCYLMVIGINKYRNPKLNLNYARADAEAFMEAITINQGRLFNSIISETLYDNDATRENVLSTLESIAEKADPSDVFYFFYAGHGSMVNDNFYFIPTESVRLYEESALQKEALYAGLIQEKFKSIKALKQVVIIDACQSGGSAELLAQRGATEEKAIAQLSRSAGVHVMASAGSEQFATEFKELGHGLFTYALLEALGGKADGAPKDGKVTIYELKSFLDSFVPDYSEKIKGKPQYPYTFSRGHDFPMVIN
ncbi:caspase family protein [Bacteroidota bacterium]